MASPETYIKIAWGYTSTIYRIPNEPKVIKVLDKNFAKNKVQRTFDREVAAYRRMSQRDCIETRKPSSILEFFGTSETIDFGIVLEFAGRGSLHEYLWDCLEEIDSRPTATCLRRWVTQTTEALVFIHDCGILHCDIHVSNCFLGDDLNIKVGDFGACAIDGEQPLMMYRRTHQLWDFDDELGQWRKDISVRSEVFALGCTMFFMETLREPFDGMHHEKDQEEIARRLQAREMPSLVGCPVMGEVVQRCWNVEYQGMSQVLEDIRAVCEVEPDVRVEANP